MEGLFQRVGSFGRGGGEEGLGVGVLSFDRSETDDVRGRTLRVDETGTSFSETMGRLSGEQADHKLTVVSRTIVHTPGNLGDGCQ